MHATMRMVETTMRMVVVESAAVKVACNTLTSLWCVEFFAGLATDRKGKANALKRSSPTSPLRLRALRTCRNVGDWSYTYINATRAAKPWG